jgi:vacuolar-type H+-ATPase subunit H
MPRQMLEEYKKIILEKQGRVLEDGEAELEAMNLLDGVSFLVELKAKDIQRKNLHRTLTNGFKEPKLGLVDSEFFG